MKRTARKVLWEGAHIRAVQIDYLDRSGIERQWEAVERVKSESVVLVVPITSTGDLILIKQYRPALDRMVMELPAGLVDKGESPINAARRELIEETGYSGKELIPLVNATMSSGIHSEPWDVFLAPDVSGASESELAMHSPDENEDIETFNVPLGSYIETLNNMSVEGIMVDLRIYGLVELAKAHMHRSPS